MPAENGRRENLATTVTEVSERVSQLVREEIELAKAEMAQKLKTLRNGLIAAVIAGTFALLLVPFGLLAAAWSINSAIGEPWPGFVIVFGALVVLFLAIGIFAWRKLRVGAPTPHMAIDEAKKIRETVAAKSDGA